MTRQQPLWPFWILPGILVITACAGPADVAREADSAGLPTTIDSGGDSIVARVTGAVPVAAVRTLVEELRIAPAADDTSLFNEVFEFDVDRAGRFWVYDSPTNTIFLFGQDGNLLRRIGRRGGGPGELKSNSGMIALGDTGLAVWDPQNARIAFFDAQGGFRASWLTPAGFATNNGLVTDRSGALFVRRPVTPPEEGYILGKMGLVRLREGGAFADSLAPPDLHVPRVTYVATRSTGGDNRSTSATSSRYVPRYFWDWHPEGYFVAAHGGRFEIVMARPAGKPIVIRRDLPPVSVADEEVEEQRAQIIWSLRQTDPAWTWSGAALPTTKAPLIGLFLARDGRIWARVAVPSERIPDDEVAPPRDSKAPVIRYRTPVVYEVFAPDGRFLGRVNFPPRSTLMEAEGDLVWAIVRDENDLPAAVRLRIEPGLR